MVKCTFCGESIDETNSKCPYCGGVNEAIQRFTDDTPRTIAELEAWYQAHNLPPYEVTRFFIGTDSRSPKVFGIYYSNQHVLLYKNLANGNRTVLYNGTDEAYAVNEYYVCLKQEILRQKARILNKH